MTPLRVAVLLTLAITQSGCALGYTGVLFVTKTNAGLEATSTPPTIQLNVARTEGVLAPQFKNGKKLPVMASFRFSSEGIFAPAVGSAFATGDAAKTMAALYGDRTPHERDWKARVKLLGKENSPVDSAVDVGVQAPEVPSLLGIYKPTFQENDVRPVFFGTDTSLGIKIAWSGMTGQFPDSARFGYNRSELALVPIAMEKPASSTGRVKMRLASLMATVDAGVRTPVTTPQEGLKFHMMQYFATGDAATLLAMQRDVREAMLTRLDPLKEERKRDFLGRDVPPAAHEVVTQAVIVLRDSLGLLAGAGDGTAAKHRERLDKAAFQVPASFKAAGLIQYGYDPSTKRLEKVIDPPPVAGPTDLVKAIAFLREVDDSRRSIGLFLEEHKKGPVSVSLVVREPGKADVTSPPAPLAPSELQLLSAQQALQDQVFAQLDRQVRSHTDVVAAARYLASQLHPQAEERDARP